MPPLTGARLSLREILDQPLLFNIPVIDFTVDTTVIDPPIRAGSSKLSFQRD